MTDEDGIIAGLIDRLGMKKLLLILKALDEIMAITGYGSVTIEIRERRIEFISKKINEDTRHL